MRNFIETQKINMSTVKINHMIPDQDCVFDLNFNSFYINPLRFLRALPRASADCVKGRGSEQETVH